jgi:uncharacterized integral membrane protein
MMHMPLVLVMMMVFLVAVVFGGLIAVRVLGGRHVDRDHPQ